MGDLHLEYERFGTRQSIEKPDVEVGTGSGFVVSPHGYVLTSDHVVRGGTSVEEVEGVAIEVTRRVNGLEIVFPPAGDGGPSRGVLSRLPASVVASDPDLDLAVLFVTGGELPYVAMGDSDAIDLGQPVQVLGYPFGRAIEIALGGQPEMSSTAPGVSVSRGSISAVRAVDEEDRRYLQIDANVNPGHSGGPTVDSDGYVVGITQMKLQRAGQSTGIGFAVPINRVKDFLEANGLDQTLPTRRLRLGPKQALEGKGLRLRLPEGRRDRLAARLRVDIGGGTQDVWFRIDRVHSAWSLEQVEDALLSRQAFEPFSPTTPASRRHRTDRVLRGHVGGTVAAGGVRLPVEMEYVLADLGRETLVGRYLGPAEQVAFNEATLRASLSSLEVEALLTAELARVPETRWSPVTDPSAPRTLVVPAGWREEAGAPLACPGLPPAALSLSASPVGDFTVAFRLSWWPAVGAEAMRAAAACSSGAGPPGRSGYGSRSEAFGISYVAQGTFVEPREGGLLQAEVVSPAAKADVASALFTGWVEALSR